MFNLVINSPLDAARPMQNSIQLINKVTDKWQSIRSFNPLSANFKKWPNTLKQFVGNLPKNCLSVFDHFVGLALKGLGFITRKSTSFSYLSLLLWQTI